MIGRAVRPAIVVVAVAAALVPLPAHTVERWYSRGIYPHLQQALTSCSNLVPFALFDVLWVAASIVFVIGLRRAVRGQGWRRGLPRFAGRALVATSVIYLIFLATWGLNYRRPPVAERIVFDPARITRAGVDALGARTAREVNALYAPAHAEHFSIGDLAEAFAAAQRDLGATRTIVPSRPKQTLLGAYFHQTSIAGMTDPFFLETLLAPDLLDVERPFVIAHEWAHLAGYADESEANFVAWIACMHGTPRDQYSAWLMMIGYVPLPGPPQNVLDPGPRIDLYAISARYAHTSPVLRFAAQHGYDTYLKANHVEAGVASYDLVVQLILGTRFGPDWTPRLR